jgi:catechol 2,3-dioxygenase
MNERLISQLAHVELLSPRPQESLDFMVDVLGLEESGREEQSVYLRCWGDHFHHSIVLTEGEAPGLGHAAWRAEGPEQLQMAVEQLESARVAGEWRDSVVGHGPAYRFRGPGGHPHELLWEVERYVAPPDKRSTYPARPQRPPARGIGCRQLDHLTVATSDPYADAIWYRDHLGYRFMEYTGLDEAPDVIVFAMVTTNEKSHDLGLTLDPSNIPGRIHHLALWVDTVEDVLQAADVVT